MACCLLYVGNVGQSLISVKLFQTQIFTDITSLVCITAICCGEEVYCSCYAFVTRGICFIFFFGCFKIMNMLRFTHNEADGESINSPWKEKRIWPPSSSPGDIYPPRLKPASALSSQVAFIGQGPQRSNLLFTVVLLLSFSHVCYWMQLCISV